MVDSRNVENRKNSLSIFCNYTITHYTHLAIEQRMQMLKMQFIHNVNGDGSKAAKIIITGDITQAM